METIIWCYRQMASSEIILGKFKNLYGTNWVAINCQELFGQHLLHDPVTSLYPPARSYQLGLLKKYIAAIEEQETGEMADVLMETLMRLISTSVGEEDLCYLSYPLPETCGVAVEEAVTVRVNQRHNEVGMRPWEAAFKLADYVVANQELFAGKRVLELGAGVGLTGLIAGLCTAADTICMTDYAPEVLANLRHNVEINMERKRNGNEETPGAKNIVVAALDWNCPEESAVSLNDWDIILAADIFYDQAQIPQLTALMQLLLRTKMDTDLNNEFSEPYGHDDGIEDWEDLSQCLNKKESPGKLRIPHFICAYTLRNQDTFNYVLSCMKHNAIECEQIEEANENYVGHLSICAVPNKDNVFLCRLSAVHPH